MDKIQRPAGIGFGFHEDRRPRTDSAASSPLAYGKAFLPTEPADAVDAQRLAFLPQQDEQPAVAEAFSLIGKLTSMRAQFGVRWPAGPIADHFAIGIDDEQARRSERPSAACRCATPSRLAAGPTIFLPEARGVRLHPASALPIASSTWRSRPRAALSAWPRGHPSHRIWPSNYTVSLPRRRAYGRNRRSSPPALCSHSTSIICSSVNLARFICPSFTRPDSNSTWRNFARAGHLFKSKSLLWDRAKHE